MFQAARLNAGNNITLDAQNGTIYMLNATASEFTQTKTYSTNPVWWKSQDKGDYVETTVHNHLLAGGSITFTAKNGVVVEYREGNGNLDQTIAKLAQAPELAWMAQLKGRNDVQWNAVREAAEHWNHKAEGLTQAATAIIALAVTIATQGAGASLLAGTSLAGNAIATSIVQAAVTKIATTATISLINNKGDLGAVFAELGSSSFIKSLATSVITAGLTTGLGTNFAAGQSGFAAIPARLIDRAITTTISTGVSVAINGGNFGEDLTNGLKFAAIDVLGESFANELGNAFSRKDFSDDATLNWALHKVAHGALGCAIGAAQGGEGGCASGAVGGVVGEIVAEEFKKWVDDKVALAAGQNLSEAQLAEFQSQLEAWNRMGVNIAKFAGGLTAMTFGLNVNTAIGTAGNAAEHNALFLIPLALAAWKAYGMVQSGLAVYNAINKLADPSISDAEKEQMLFDLASQMALEMAGGRALQGANGLLKKMGIDIVSLAQKLGGRAMEKFMAALDGKVCNSAGQCNPACFVAGTPVWTAGGMKPIEEIRAGDIVLSRDEEGKMTRFARVDETFIRKAPVVRVQLEDASGRVETLGTTFEHPFHVPEMVTADGKIGTFVAAGALRPGMMVSTDRAWKRPLLRLTAADGRHDTAGFLRVKAVTLAGFEDKVYNFNVAGTHTYFVGETKAWVHNTQCTGTTPGGMPRTSAEWRERYGPASIREHHLVPQVMLNNEAFVNRLRSLGISDPQKYIDRQIAQIPNAQHQAAHADGWNNDWGQWFRANQNFTLGDLQAQIKNMMYQYNLPMTSRNFTRQYGRN